MRKTLVLALCLAFLLPARPAPAGAPGKRLSLIRIPWNVTEHRLSNGMRALLLPDRRAPMVIFEVWYGAGSREERPGKTGLAHMVEHMMFRGTKKYGPKEYSNLIKRNGGSHNAFTSFDYTAYYVRIPSDRLEIAVELEADRMANLLLKKEEFEPERSVILEERRSRTEDRPTGLLFEQLQAAAYTAHTYGNPIIGWEGDIRAYTLEDMRAFYHRYYQPKNAVAVLVGDFEPEKAIRLLEKHFGRIPAPSFPGRPLLREPRQRGERRILVRKEAQLPYLAMAHHAPNWRSKDAPALVMLETILGGGETSRLHQRLVRKDEVALSAGADYTYISLDPHLFYLFAQVAPGKTAAEAERTIQEEIDRLVRDGVTQAELSRSLRQLESRTVFALDSNYRRAMLLGQSAIAGNWHLLERYLPRLAKVTAADVVRVAKKYLARDNRTTAELVPLPPTRPVRPPAGGGPGRAVSVKKGGR